MTFSAVLSALGLAPKTLPQANETLTAAKAQLDSVNALFTAAGLQLEPMLAAGPDSLKAHLASLDQSAEVTRLTGLVAKLNEGATTAADLIATLEESNQAIGEIVSTVGIDIQADDAAAIKTKFEAHVAKQTTLALAKTGHPPAHVPAAASPEETAPKTAESIFEEYSKMEAGELKQAFYAKNEAAIWAGKRLADSKAK